jgi:ABC-type glycerol-3-phosphate transport system permease component
VLPEAPKIPPRIKISFAWTRWRGNRVYVAGHAATNANGSPAGPFSKVPTEVALAVIVLFFFAQRYFMRGIVTTGLAAR